MKRVRNVEEDESGEPESGEPVPKRVARERKRWVKLDYSDANDFFLAMQPITDTELTFVAADPRNSAGVELREPGGTIVVKAFGDNKCSLTVGCLEACGDSPSFKATVNINDLYKQIKPSGRVQGQNVKMAMRYDPDTSSIIIKVGSGSERSQTVLGTLCKDAEEVPDDLDDLKSNYTIQSNGATLGPMIRNLSSVANDATTGAITFNVYEVSRGDGATVVHFFMQSAGMSMRKHYHLTCVSRRRESANGDEVVEQVINIQDDEDDARGARGASGDSSSSGDDDEDILRGDANFSRTYSASILESFMKGSAGKRLSLSLSDVGMLVLTQMINEGTGGRAARKSYVTKYLAPFDSDEPTGEGNKAPVVV